MSKGGCPLPLGRGSYFAVVYAVWMTKKPKPPQAQIWRIYRVRYIAAQYLGHVEATDDAEAIVKAIGQFNIEPLHPRSARKVHPSTNSYGRGRPTEAVISHGVAP